MLFGLAVVLAGGGSAIGVAVAEGPKKVVVIDAIAKPFLQANVLLENLGSPPPAGERSAAWALAGDPLSDPAGRPRLTKPERPWVAPDGALLGLSSADATGVLSGQLGLDASILTGALRSRYDTELRTIVAAERRRPPQPSSPGGARIVTWYSLVRNGTTATADAVVATWEQRDTIVGSGASRRVDSTIEQAEVESQATLREIGGRWFVATLNQLPWQATT